MLSPLGNFLFQCTCMLKIPSRHRFRIRIHCQPLISQQDFDECYSLTVIYIILGHLWSEFSGQLWLVCGSLLYVYLFSYKDNAVSLYTQYLTVRYLYKCITNTLWGSNCGGSSLGNIGSWVQSLSFLQWHKCCRRFISHNSFTLPYGCENKYSLSSTYLTLLVSLPLFLRIS